MVSQTMIEVTITEFKVKCSALLERYAALASPFGSLVTGNR
jgi:hypothetical protein